MTNLGKRIREFRESHSLTYEQMAERLHCHLQRVKDLERGRHETNVHEQIAILILLGAATNDAIAAASESEVVDMTDIDLEAIADLALDDPLIFEREGQLVISTREGWNYPLSPAQFDTPEKAIDLLSHLLQKTWFTKSHCRDLLGYFCRHLGILK